MNDICGAGSSKSTVKVPLRCAQWENRTGSLGNGRWVLSSQELEM